MFKPGQRVLCIDMDKDYLIQLTIGNIYTVARFSPLYPKSRIFIKEKPFRKASFHIIYFIAIPDTKLTRLLFNEI